MELTVDSGCTYISTTTPDSNILEDWANGDLSDVQVTISFNCTEVTNFYLPNQYQFGSSQAFRACETILGGQEFGIEITGITNAQINTTTVTDTSANIVSVTPITKTRFTVVMNTAFTNYIEFEILDVLGYTYLIRIDFSAQILDECDFTDTISVLELPELPCGITFTPNTLIIYNEYLRADCNFPCEDDCRQFCDGIYTIQVGEELSCIFVNCSTDCNVVDYFIENGGDIMILLEALKVGSELASIGNTDCVTCSQLCDIFNRIQKLLGNTTKNILEDCGCNNN